MFDSEAIKSHESIEYNALYLLGAVFTLTVRTDEPEGFERNVDFPGSFEILSCIIL